jgi:hypothetical protein
MIEEEWENEWTQDEWEAYEDQQAQLAQDEAKGTSSKDSSFEVVETPLPKAPKIDSRKTSPIKRKVDEEKTPEEIQQQGSIINRNIQVVFEKYPEIRSTENFGMLQAQLEGTENQVKTERDLYNEAVKQFNSYVRGFWKHKALGLVGNDDEEFKVRKMFEADAGSEVAPKVSFE